MHTNCQNCGRPLRNQASRTIGYGPKCYRRIRNTDLTGEYSPAQIEAAFQLIDDAGILPIRPTVWMTVSTDGQSIHRTAHNACTCPAGIRGTLCYHRAAVALITR